MKPFRFLAAFLLILSGILHFLPIFKTPDDPNALPMLAFGVVYFITGALLLTKLKFAPILGLIFPLIGLGTGFLVVGFNSWDTFLWILFSIDAVVAICCLFVLLNRNK